MQSGVTYGRYGIPPVDAHGSTYAYRSTSSAADSLAAGEAQKHKRASDDAFPFLEWPDTAFRMGIAHEVHPLRNACFSLSLSTNPNCLPPIFILHFFITAVFYNPCPDYSITSAIHPSNSNFYFLIE